MSLSQRKKLEGDAARDAAAIRASALRLLARREHSRQELTTKLQARGFESAAVAGVVAALAARNLLSDARFVGEFVASRLRRGSGPAKIREALRGRGIAAEQVNQELAERDGEWVQHAEAARRKRFGMELPRDYAARVRQARFLQQRGFTAEQIRQVFKQDFERDGWLNSNTGEG